MLTFMLNGTGLVKYFLTRKGWSGWGGWVILFATTKVCGHIVWWDAAAGSSSGSSRR